MITDHAYPILPPKGGKIGVAIIDYNEIITSIAIIKISRYDIIMNEIENALRTNAIIAASRAMNITDADLIDYASDSLDEQQHHAYDATDNARLTIIMMMLALIGSDDDLDDLIHDLSHATDQLDYCTDHPTICASCCDDH